MSNEIIFDFETLSQDALNGVAVDCSFFLFDRDRFISENPYTLKDAADVLKLKLSVEDQVKKYKWEISKDTLDWWQKQSPEAQKKIRPSEKDITVEEFAESVLEYATSKGKINYWWSRSNTFDPIFLQRIMQATGNIVRFSKAFPFWAVRDTRTWIDAKFDFPKENGFVPIEDVNLWNKVFLAHDSRFDIIADVLRMQAIARAEKDMEPV